MPDTRLKQMLLVFTVVLAVGILLSSCKDEGGECQQCSTNADCDDGLACLRFSEVAGTTALRCADPNDPNAKCPSLFAAFQRSNIPIGTGAGEVCTQCETDQNCAAHLACVEFTDVAGTIALRCADPDNLNMTCPSLFATFQLADTPLGTADGKGQELNMQERLDDGVQLGSDAN